MRWILGSRRLPEVGKSVFCRKSYYANKSGIGKTVFTIGKKNKNGDLSVIERWPANWEWLDEDAKKETGLLDRNGVELFEGDDLRYFSHEGYLLPDFTATVVWMPESACFGYKRHDTTEWLNINAFVEHDELKHDFLNYCEVLQKAQLSETKVE